MISGRLMPGACLGRDATAAVDAFPHIDDKALVNITRLSGDARA